MLGARMIALPCCPFELSPLNEHYRGKLVRTITLIPLRYFDNICYSLISSQDRMSHAIIRDYLMVF